MTRAQRINARQDKIWETAMRLKQPSIEIDGITYQIPKFLQDATDEEIKRSLWFRARQETRS